MPCESEIQKHELSLIEFAESIGFNRNLDDNEEFQSWIALYKKVTTGYLWITIRFTEIVLCYTPEHKTPVETPNYNAKLIELLFFEDIDSINAVEKCLEYIINNYDEINNKTKNTYKIIFFQTKDTKEKYHFDLKLSESHSCISGHISGENGFIYELKDAH